MTGCSPHVRGDGPRSPSLVSTDLKFSPRAWGWSVGKSLLACTEIVLPTCVGMVRNLSSALAADACSPHVRGDGPRWCDATDTGGEFSPRAWGWSECLRGTPDQVCVLPTCVGMVRQHPTPAVLAPCSPHVRGDGPISLAELEDSALFSPRAWGWSATAPTPPAS